MFCIPFSYIVTCRFFAVYGTEMDRLFAHLGDNGTIYDAMLEAFDSISRGISQIVQGEVPRNVLKLPEKVMEIPRNVMEIP